MKYKEETLMRDLTLMLVALGIIRLHVAASTWGDWKTRHAGE